MLEFLSFLVGIPMALIYRKTVNFEGRVSAVETTQAIYTEIVDKICNSNDELSKEVHELIGQIKQMNKN